MSNSVARSACMGATHATTRPRARTPAASRQQRTRPPAAGGNGSGPVPASASAVVTDAAVPEAHKGLHSLLYGDGGAEAHDAAPAGGPDGYDVRRGEDDGTFLVDAAAYLDAREGERPAGVFAVYDASRALQYVSFSRNVVLALRALRARVGAERCAHVRVMVFANRAMQTRAALQREADNWVAEAGAPPPGNAAERELWEGAAAFDPGAMTPEELAAYEDKKMKMQKAMGEKTAAAAAEGEGGAASAEGADDDPATRRAKMIEAMDGGDWSAVIDGQTQETVAGRPAAGQRLQQQAKDQRQEQAKEQEQEQEQLPPRPPITTPFARASVHRSVGSSAPGSGAGGAPPAFPPLTLEAADLALNDVRPYLIADGGNVEVVSVENGVVMLQLQGACGTCPSSTATMKMGIERALRAAFGDQLKEVMQVGGPVDTAASVPAVDAHLNMLRGAVAAYGGSVEVVAVGGGCATLRYRGPKPIAYGLVAAVKDKFPDLREVVVLDADSGEQVEF